jgi:hypothetical protein
MRDSKILRWLNSGEYLVNIDQTRTDIMKGAASSINEAETASIFERELYYLVRTNTGISLNYSSERPVDGLTHKFSCLSSRTSGRGRLDAVINNLIIEYKHNSKLKTVEQIKTASMQVEDYMKALYKNEKIKYNAILTDGIKISYFSFNGENIEHSILTTIETKDIDTIIRAILFNNTKQFVPVNILKDFSINVNVDSISKSIANLLYFVLRNNPTGKTLMLYEEWQSLMHLSIEDNGKGNDIAKRRKDLSLIFKDSIDDSIKEYKALYALQTTYSIIVKLIACKVIDKLEYNDNTSNYYDLTTITSMEMQKFFEKMEDGYSYRSSNLFNFLEGDFFSWYSDKDQWSTEFWSTIIEAIKCIDQYSAFSFNISYAPIDIFKDLYMSIIPRSIRHSMGEYFTPEWLADCVINQAITDVKKNDWKAIDPCCGSGIFVISLIKHIVGDKQIHSLSEYEKKELQKSIISRVYGIDINPLSVLSARVGYYLALLPFGNMHDIEIPIYLGDSAIIPIKIVIDGIPCYKYSVTNNKMPFDIIFPERFVKAPDFGNVMNQLQSCVKTDDSKILYEVIYNKLNCEEKKSNGLIAGFKDLSDKLVYLHKNNWDGIWIRIATNFMLIARLSNFDVIVGNPPWVKWEHLPALYAFKIKELCNIKHIFSNDGGRFGGTQLNICALIANVTATNWLSKNGVLALLMPDSIMSQNSYEEFRNFYTNYETKERLYLQKIDRWLPPLRPFRCDNKPITQDFITYYFSSNKIDYKKGIDVRVISRKAKVKDENLNMNQTFYQVKDDLIISRSRAIQLSEKSTAFSYVSDNFDYSKIIGTTDYRYRTGVEFTPQELFMLIGKQKCVDDNFYYFGSKKFAMSKYKINDEPKMGWKLPVKYIYPIVTGPNVEPFKYLIDNNFCILPYDKNNTKEPIKTSVLISKYPELFNYLVNHKELIDQQSEKSKKMHRGEEFYSLSKIGPYTFADYIVAARDNSKFCAAVVEKSSTPWGYIKETICVKHTIIISQDKNGNYISLDEANYICGILNSTIVISYIQSTFKSNGYSLNKSNLYIPKFDPTNKLHREIANLAKIAKNSDNEQIKKIQEQITNIYIKICKAK